MSTDHRHVLRASLLVLGVALAACGPTATAPTTAPSAGPATPAPATPAGEPTPTAAPPTLPPTVAITPPPPVAETLTEAFPADAFSDPTRVDNQWLPMIPGTRWVWKGEATIDGERLSRQVELVITDLTKEVYGVQALVVHEFDITDGVLNEAEIIFFAQDDAGNIWHLGQFPEEYEDGTVVDAPLWIAGFEGASAGLWMPGSPQYTAASYSQGYAPSVGWTDRARVLELGSVTCVPVDCYENVLVIDEFNRDEPDTHQLKYYAPGIGGVRVGWAGAREEEREELELVLLETLDEERMDAVREAVIAQDERGYELSPDVYGQLPRIERAPTSD